MEKPADREILKKAFLERMEGEIPNKLFILHDDGVYRHLRLAKAIDSLMEGFDLITFPGALVFTGDYGDYTWKRIEDMAYFFSGENTDFKTRTPDFSYWAEKLVAEGMYASRKTRQFDDEGVRKEILARYVEYCDEHPEMSDAKKIAIWERLDNEVLQPSDYSSSEACEFEMRNRLYDYSENDRRGAPAILHNTYDWGMHCLTDNYIWACYCVAWGLEQYHKQKKEVK